MVVQHWELPWILSKTVHNVVDERGCVRSEDGSCERLQAHHRRRSTGGCGCGRRYAPGGCGGCGCGDSGCGSCGGYIASLNRLPIRVRSHACCRYD